MKNRPCRSWCSTSSRPSKAAARCTSRWRSIPLYFDDLFVNLVEAGEHAGALETLLDKIATYKEKTEALKKKIKKALFYPDRCFGRCRHRFLHIADFRHPAVRILFKGFGADLPAFTQMVVNLSRFMQHQGWMVV